MKKTDPPKYGNLKAKALVVVELCHICSDTLVDVRPHQTIGQDVHVAQAAQLEGEETRTLTMMDKQTAAPDNPSFFNTFPSPAMPADLETTVPSPEQPQAPAQERRSMRTHKPSCIEDDSQSEQVVQPGTNAPHLAPSLQAPGAFAEDPDEAGGATTVEGGAPAPLVDPTAHSRLSQRR